MKPVIAMVAAACLAYSGLVLSQEPEAAKTLIWDANPEPDIAGHRLHFGQVTSGTYERTVDVGNVTQSSQELQDGERWIVVTAYNTAGLESLPSNEIDLLRPRPGAPKKFRRSLPGWIKNAFIRQVERNLARI